MQTALHIAALVGQLKAEIVGGTITATEFYKKERAAYLFIRKAKALWALAFVYHPAGSGCILIPARKAQPETREKPWPVFGLQDFQVIDVSQPVLDRIFFIDVASPTDGNRQQIVVQAIGPNGNLWLLDNTGGALATLRKREFVEGQAYQVPPMPSGKVDPRTITPEAMGEVCSSGGSVVTAIEKRVIGFNRTLALETVQRAGLDFVEAGELTTEDLASLAETIADMAGRFARADGGYLYSIRGAWEAYPFKLSHRDEQGEKCKSLSLGILETIQRRQGAREEADEQQKVSQAITRALKRLDRRIANVSKDIAEAQDYERFKKLAELLQIHRDRIEKGMSSVTVEDVLATDGTEIEIALDPALSTQDNIESYFRRHRKGREGLALLQRRLEITRAERDSLAVMAEAIERDFDRACQQYAQDLASLLPREASRRETAPRLPYKEHTLSTGATVFVGRDGADNDRTTFEFARPYELWFHAQQCPGSHVVLKFPNKSFEPSQVEITEAASLAAWHSKARHNSLVPVIYTQRKYVRKPRKAKPGLVTVEREKSVMVEPSSGV